MESVATAHELRLMPSVDDVHDVAEQILRLQHSEDLGMRLGKILFHAYSTAPEELSLIVKLFSKSVQDNPDSDEALYWEGEHPSLDID